MVGIGRRDPVQRRQLGKLFVFLMVVGFIVILLSGAALIKVVQLGLYKNAQFGIQIKYPLYWQVIYNPGPGAVVAFSSLPQDSLDKFRENVNITYHDLSQDPMTLDAFSKTIVKQVTMTFQGYIEVLESRSINLRGRRGYRFMYVGNNPDIPDPVQYLHVWTVIGDKAFVITYVARKPDFDLFKTQVNMMIDSFDVWRPEQKPG